MDHRMRNHPDSERFHFLMNNISRYMAYSEAPSLVPPLEGRRLRLTFARWHDFNLRDPLYRNQEEFVELCDTSRNFALGLRAAAECEDKLIASMEQAKF